MKEKIKELNLFQKIVLILLAVMVVLFFFIYTQVLSKTGFSYRDAILIPETVGTDTVYAGKVYGEQVSFTVTEENAVTVSHGGETYGPYTAKEDPSAIPREHGWAELMTGVEIRCGEEIFFRGGVVSMGESDLMLIHENGDLGNELQITAGSGTVRFTVTPEALLRLMNGPELTHKGDWTGWLLGAFLSIATAFSILFADELFRFSLSFRIRDAYRAEPSEWEVLERYISWTVLPVAALVLYIMGLS